VRLKHDSEEIVETGTYIGAGVGEDVDARAGDAPVAP